MVRVQLLSKRCEVLVVEEFKREENKVYSHDIAAKTEMPNPIIELANVVKKLMMVNANKSGGKLMANEHA